MQKKIANNPGARPEKLDNYMKRRAKAVHGMDAAASAICSNMSRHAEKNGNKETASLFASQGKALAKVFSEASEHAAPSFWFEKGMFAVSAAVSLASYFLGLDLPMKLGIAFAGPVSAFTSYLNFAGFAGQVVNFFNDVVREKFTSKSAGYDYLLEKFL
ncbi:MAG: hypothetical protein WC506_04470 [Candidatus Micrarchaeia archaeon]